MNLQCMTGYQWLLTMTLESILASDYVHTRVKLYLHDQMFSY